MIKELPRVQVRLGTGRKDDGVFINGFEVRCSALELRRAGRGLQVEVTATFQAELKPERPWKKVVVLARNHEHAALWASRNHIALGDWLYANSPEKVRALSHFVVKELDGWTLHPYAKEIAETLKIGAACSDKRFCGDYPRFEGEEI